MFDQLILILTAFRAKVPILPDILAWWLTADGCVTELMRAIQRGHWNHWHFSTISWINTLKPYSTVPTHDKHKSELFTSAFVHEGLPGLGQRAICPSCHLIGRRNSTLWSTSLAEFWKMVKHQSLDDLTREIHWCSLEEQIQPTVFPTGTGIGTTCLLQ